MREIILKNRAGNEVARAQVDDQDYDYLSQWMWRRNAFGYGVRSEWVDGKFTVYFMHRVIMDAPKGVEVDHINRDRLDNRRKNLRLVTRQQNAANTPPRPIGRSKYKGVSPNRRQARPWRARIVVNGKEKQIGTFASEEEAAKAYDAAAREYFGEYAYTNFQEV